MRKLKLLALFAGLMFSVGMWAGGSCGGGLTWNFSSYTLTLSHDGEGSGVMDDYTMNHSPWKSETVMTLSLPDGLTHIGNYAFQSLAVSAITMPNTVTSIGEGAFMGGFAANSISIPASVTSIQNKAFDACPVSTITVNGSNMVYDSRNNCNAIIETATNKLIKGCKNTVIPNDVVLIGDYAFGGCENMTSIEIPSNVTSIGSNAFENCTGLASITLNEGLTSIGSSAFSSCNSLTSISIPKTVTRIENGTFSSCSALSSVNLPASITEIGMMAFSNCNHLTEITCLAKTPPTAYTSSFNNVPKSIPVYIPKGKTAAYQAATGWSDFTNFIELDGENQWISGTCTITLEDGVLTVAPTDGVEGVMAPLEPNEEEYPWYEYREEVTKIVMHDGVTSLFAKFFHGCSNATSAHISNSAIMIGRHAFGGCSSLTSIVIPQSISAINEDAFNGCTGMTDIYCYFSPYTVHLYWPDANLDDFKPAKQTNCHVYPSVYDVFVGYWGPDGEQGERNLTFVGDLDEILTIGDSENAGAIDEFLAGHKGELIPEMTIERPVYRNTFYNTICLPFSMNAEQLNNSSIASATIKEFVGANVQDDVLHLTLSEVNTIEAGKPYFISYNNASALDELTFHGVQIADNEEPAGVTHNGVTLQGTYHGFDMPAQTAENHSYLFLGQNNTLYWPSVAGHIKPFRAYFITSSGGSAPIRRGMHAVFEDANAPAVVTAIENAENDVQSTKIMENGQMIIIRNGVKYNAAGQIVK